MLSERDVENLEWALRFLRWYEKKHKIDRKEEKYAEGEIRPQHYSCT
jgi:hypothetical protein